MARTNRQFHLVRLPDGPLTGDCFRLAEAAIPEPKDGEVVLKVRYISLDAANRAWMQGATYRAAVEAGTVMAGGGVAEVVESKAPASRRRPGVRRHRLAGIRGRAGEH